MAGQSNIFIKPELNDPFGSSISEFKTGMYNSEKRPNINPSQKKQAQAAWMKSIDGSHNKLK